MDASAVYGIRRPSTGVRLLHRLAQLGKRVTAFGFDGGASGHYWNPWHQHGHLDDIAALDRLSNRIAFAR
jgi:hypothetical protein